MVLTRKPPTIQDVARLARVSSATVSRVLSSPERVAEATRQRVFAAIKEAGYALNQSARSLRLGVARQILLALPSIGDPFYGMVLQGALAAATDRGYSVLVTARLEDNPRQWLADYLVANRADGLVLFAGGLDTNALRASIPDDQPLPLVAAYDELPDPQINSVLTDNRAAARRAVRHLIDLGHTRIGHIAGPSRNAAPNERFVGFHEEVAAARLSVRPEWVVAGDFSMPSGAAFADHIAALDDRPTAIFAGNDEMAIGLISRLRAHGIECPRDMSVVGFDDINIAPHYFPPLTTMRQHRDQIGSLATHAVIDIIEGMREDTSPSHLVLTSPLVVRASTAPSRGP